MERFQGSHSIPGQKESRGVILSWDWTSTGKSFCLGIERLQGSHSVLVERLQGSHSVLGWNESRGVILSWDRKTPGESICPGMEKIQGSHSVLVKRLLDSFVTDEDLWGRNVLHIDSIATCSLETDRLFNHIINMVDIIN